MKIHCCKTILPLGLAGFLLMPKSSFANDQNSGFYIGTDIGLNRANSLTESSGSISLNSGVRWDISTGYAFQLPGRLTLGPDLEVGIIYNPLDQATPSGGQGASISGEYLQVPLLANGVLKWEAVPHLVIYGGGGAGCDAGSLEVTGVSGVNTDIVGSEVDFAWQALAGIRYRFNSCEIGVGYKYLAVKPSGLRTVGNNAILASVTAYF